MFGGRRSVMERPKPALGDHPKPLPNLRLSVSVGSGQWHGDLGVENERHGQRRNKVHNSPREERPEQLLKSSHRAAS